MSKLVHSTAGLELVLLVALGTFLVGFAALFFGNKKNDDARMAVGVLLLVASVVSIASSLIKLFRM